MSEATNKIKTRIMALLAKASGTDNAIEAELFLGKAHELLAQYQLDIADLVDAGDPILKHFGYTAAETGHAWRWNLYSMVAQLYGCKTCFTFGKGTWNGSRMVFEKTATVVGRESAIITTDLMYPWIVGQVRDKAKEVAKITGMSEQGQAKRIAAALVARIYHLIQANKAAAPATAAGRNALVIMDQVEAQFDALFPDLKPGRAVKVTTDRLSVAAANSIGLHRQTPSGKTLKLGSN